MYLITEDQLEKLINRNNAISIAIAKDIESTKLGSEVRVVSTLKEFTEALSEWSVVARMDIHVEVEDKLSNGWYNKEIDFENMTQDVEEAYVEDNRYIITKKSSFCEAVYSCDLDYLKQVLKEVVTDNHEVILLNFKK